MDNFKITLSFITPDYTSEEYSETHPSLPDAIEESDDLAFSTVGFPLDHWKKVDFGEGNQLYYFYPNEEDKTSRYKLAILKEEV